MAHDHSNMQKVLLRANAENEESCMLQTHLLTLRLPSTAVATWAAVDKITTANSMR
jgi:hypothetical protein